jgi:hypothetical protein
MSLAVVVVAIKIGTAKVPPDANPILMVDGHDGSNVSDVLIMPNPVNSSYNSSFDGWNPIWRRLRGNISPLAQNFVNLLFRMQKLTKNIKKNRITSSRNSKKIH